MHDWHVAAAGNNAGYESGDALTDALAHGCEDAGPLRIWVKDD
jgi:hypothetical protein